MWLANVLADLDAEDEMVKPGFVGDGADVGDTTRDGPNRQAHTSCRWSCRNWCIGSM